jgi:hypothetical protein
VALVTLATAVLVTGSAIYLATQVKRDISEQYIERDTANAEQIFGAMRSSVEKTLAIARGHGELGSLSLSQADGLRNQLLPLFRNDELLSGISVADIEGRSYFIQPDGTERRPGDDATFDAKERPWFRGALNTNGVYWTEQYLFHTRQELGITASISFIPPDGEEKMIVAADIPLTDLYRRIKTLATSPNSDVIIVRDREYLLVPSSASDAPDFIPVSALTNSVIRQAHTNWRRRQDEPAGVFSFMDQGRIWWCGFRPLDKTRRDVWVGVLVPEADIIRQAGRHRMVLLAFGLAFAAVLAGGALWLLSRYRRTFESTPFAETENTAEGVQERIAEGENRYVEFKSTMRMNLHAGKPGKEIELAWLKGIAAFMNTDGGTLLLGVTDAGEITGIERDLFENEDKCRLHFKNLIARHIGAELSKHVRLVLVPVEGLTVGVVHCSRSPEPVFLKEGNNEHFYIRNGPSSDELPVSKALKYIKNRK